MATLGQWTGGSVSILPGTSWAAPNGLFPTQDRNDGSAYSFASSTSTLTLPSTGLADGYLFLWGYEFHDTSNGRHNPQGRMIQASGTGTFQSATTGGYNRDNSEDRAYVSGWSFVDNPSASSTYQFQWKRDTDAPTGGTQRSFIQVVPLYYADVGIYGSTNNAAAGGTTPVQIGGLTGTDGTNITVASNTVSMTGDNKRYLVLGSAFHDTLGTGSRTQRWFGLRVDGSKDDAAKGCAYFRNAANDEMGISFMRLLETSTATRTVDLFEYRGDGVGAGQGGADVDGATTSTTGAHALVVIELNDNAEVWSSTNGSNTQEFALTGPVDVNIADATNVEFNDSASFTRASDTAVNAEQDMDVLGFANVSHARESGSIGSGARWTVHGEFTVNGTEQTGAGFHGNYNRGNQGSQDCMGSSTNMAGFFALSSGDDFGVSNQELAGTEGGAGDIESQAGWVGFGLINLDTLEATGGTDDLLADDVQSTSETTTPSIGQEHALLADDVSSLSETTTPAIGQTHELLADDVESASQSSDPAVGEPGDGFSNDIGPLQVGGNDIGPLQAQEGAASSVQNYDYFSEDYFNPGYFSEQYWSSAGSATGLLPDDVESASEVSTPAIGQTHNALADDLESASEVTAPAIGQTHELAAGDAESASEASSPAIGQSHTLLAEDVESASETSTPAVGQGHSLAADDVQAASELTTPSIGQAHALTSVDAVSQSEVGTPAIGQVHALLADDAESASETSTPAIGQTHDLLANDVESASALSQPNLADIPPDSILAEDVESQAEVTTPALGQTHDLLADDLTSNTQVSEPDLLIIVALNAISLESLSEVSTPAIGQVHNLSAVEPESVSEVTTPTLVDVEPGTDTLLAEDVESASTVSVPALRLVSSQQEVGGGVYTDADVREAARKRKLREEDEAFTRILLKIMREIA